MIYKIFWSHGSLYRLKDHTKKHNMIIVQHLLCLCVHSLDLGASMQLKHLIYLVPTLLGVSTVFPETYSLFIGNCHPCFYLYFHRVHVTMLEKYPT